MNELIFITMMNVFWLTAAVLAIIHAAYDNFDAAAMGWALAGILSVWVLMLETLNK